MFRMNEVYTRAEIHNKLGGSVQSYLPTVKGRVVCACLKFKLNPDAPEVILCGVRPRVQVVGEILATQKEAVPVFMKKKSNQWEYVGVYKASRDSRKAKDLSCYSQKAKRPLSRVIFMAKG